MMRAIDLRLAGRGSNRAKKTKENPRDTGVHEDPRIPSVTTPQDAY